GHVVAMNDFNVIDSFLQTFIRYIDSGFGLLSGSVAGLASILVAIDVTLAAVFWLLDGEANVMARLIKKVLYVGAFASSSTTSPTSRPSSTTRSRSLDCRRAPT